MAARDRRHSPLGRALPFPEPAVTDSNGMVSVDARNSSQEAGADVNAVNADGNTALHPTASPGMVRVIQWLADHGAKVGVVNQSGRTPLDLAAPRVDPRSSAELGSKAAEELLRRLGASPARR